jgi:putative salt-induced outer membrane protein YdiY
MILLDTLESRGTLGALLQSANTPAVRNALLDRWAAHRGNATSDAKTGFIEATGISQAHKTAYRNWRNSQDRSIEYRDSRPRRAAAGANR